MAVRNARRSVRFHDSVRTVASDVRRNLTVEEKIQHGPADYLSGKESLPLRRL